MGRRVLDIVLVSASSLTRQYPGFRMVVHAQAYITNDSMPVQYTSADCFRDVNPRWDHPLRFSLNCSSGGTTSTEYLNIDLFNTMPDGCSWIISSLRIPLLRFLLGASQGATGFINDSWPVSTGGHLYFSYKLGAYVNRVPRIGSTVSTIGGIVGTVGAIGSTVSTIDGIVQGTSFIASLFGLN
ncbi:protein SRC2-like [Carex rostrata]